MIFAIATFLTNLFGLNFDTAKKLGKWLILIGGILLFAAVVFIFSSLSNCNNRRTEQKIQKTKTDILKGKIEANHKANEINAHAENSNRAELNVNSATGKPLSEMGNDYNKANNRYCESFPADCK